LSPRRRVPCPRLGPAALAALLPCCLGCPVQPTTPPPEPPPPAVPALEPEEQQAAAREALAFVAELRGLEPGDGPEVRILPPGAFVARRDAAAGLAAAGPAGDDLLVGLRTLAGLGLLAGADVSTRHVGGEQLGSYDCLEHVIDVADLRYLPPPEDWLAVAGPAAGGWRALTVSLHGLLAHESLHALRRTSFDLPCPATRLWPARDADFALRALEEGDAELVLAAAIRDRAAPDAPDLGLWTAVLDETAWLEPGTGIDIFAFLPYVAGEEFARALEAAGGNAALDQAYRNPPVSTEQILHPERFFAGDQPDRLELPEPAALRDQGWAPIDRGPLGEAGILALFTGAAASSAAAEVVGLPPGACDPPPADCLGLTALPGAPALPPGMSLGLDLALPTLPTLPAPPPGTPAPPPVAEPARATEDWSLRDSLGRLRPAAWTRVRAAADGWEGDTAAFWQRPDRETPALLWATTWDGACDAEQFRRELSVARPAWGACRKGRAVFVVAGLPGAAGADVLAQLAAETTVQPVADRPFDLAPRPVPGRLEERAVAELADEPVDGWPTRAAAGYAATGPVVLRRWIDEDADLRLPLPAGPYWQRLPADLASPLLRGTALGRIGGGTLVVATVEPIAVPLVERRLAEQLGTPLEEAACPRGPARRAEVPQPPTGDEPGGPRTMRALLVQAERRTIVVVGRLPDDAAEASRREYEAAFAAACGTPQEQVPAD
jgi:hypothetical protein